MYLQDAQSVVVQYYDEAMGALNKVPGSAMVVRYIRNSHQNDPVRSAIELVLVLFFVRYLLAPSYSMKKQNFVTLTEQEVDDLVDEWTPDPLVAPLTAIEEGDTEKQPVIVGPTGPKSKLSNGRTVMNLASYNFYDLANDGGIKANAIKVLRSHGVGPCGPPNFYGTQDVHIETEAKLASFLGTEKVIIYAHAFSTITSVIPSFSKRGDIIVADRAVNYAIRKGLEASRSTILWYEHNDMEDLERVLQKLVKGQAGKPLTRRFIVTEGLSETIGDVVDLPKLIELKLKYKFRLILDETWSFGVLGRTGRGITEAQNVDISQVDMTIGSLSGPLCAAGGFCAGSSHIVDHQRISSLAYTFSAALPAMLSSTASNTLDILQSQPEILVTCRKNIKALRAQLDPRSDWVVATSSIDNPILLLVLKPSVVSSRNMTHEDQEFIMQECVDEALANGVLITRLKTMPLAPGSNAKDLNWQVQPALKVCVTTGLTKKQIEKAGVIIRHAITKVLTRKTSSRPASLS